MTTFCGIMPVSAGNGIGYGISTKPAERGGYDIHVSGPARDDSYIVKPVVPGRGEGYDIEVSAPVRSVLFHIGFSKVSLVSYIRVSKSVLWFGSETDLEQSYELYSNTNWVIN
jgi:hypothetical protein